MHNLIEYRENYSKNLGSLQQYYKDEPADKIVNSESFKSKIRVTGKTSATSNTKNIEIAGLLNCSENCATSSAVRKTKFPITDKNLYVPFVTLSTQDNVELLERLKLCFKRTINWNKYQSKVSLE